MTDLPAGARHSRTLASGCRSRLFAAVGAAIMGLGPRARAALGRPSGTTSHVTCELSVLWITVVIQKVQTQIYLRIPKRQGLAVIYSRPSRCPGAPDSQQTIALGHFGPRA